MRDQHTCGEVFSVLRQVAATRSSSPPRTPLQDRSGWESYWAPNLFLNKSAIAPRGQFAAPQNVGDRKVPWESSPGGKWPRPAEEIELLDRQEAEREHLGQQRHHCGNEEYSLQDPGALPDIKARSFPAQFPAGMVGGLLHVRPTSTMGAAAACGSFLLSLRLAPLSHACCARVPIGGALSALAAATGCASCVVSLGIEPTSKTVQLWPWATLALACLCGAISPLSLCPVSKMSLASVAAPVRLALPGAIGAAVTFELVHRYWARIDPSRVAALCQTEKDRFPPSWNPASLLMRAGEHWWRHFCPGASTNRGVGVIYFASHLVVTYFSVHVDLNMTRWRNGFLGVLQARDASGFHIQLWDFAPLAFASMLLSVYGQYLMTIWDLRWREELTRDFISMWLERRSYYFLRFMGQMPLGPVDNFDQRVVEDTALFASSSRGLLCGAAEAAMRLAVFGPMLVQLSPTPLVWQLCFFLSLASSIATHAVGRPLVKRNAALQRTEADFRASLMRLRIFAEDIALQHGEPAEVRGAVHYLEDVKAAVWLAARGNLHLTTFTSAYGLVGGIIPLLLLAPSYFNGQISLGLMFQIEALVQGVRQSLDFFVGSYSEIAVWQAAASRLLALEECVVEAQWDMSPTLTTTPGAALSAEGLTLATPAGEVLIEDVSFEWRRGERVVVCGPPGSGKSALLRMVAGAWPPHCSGCAAPSLPTAGVLLLCGSGFVLPHRATLRACLAYPEAIAAFDDELQDALGRCGLSMLAKQLDREEDWASLLTLGHRQRLMFARLIARWPRGIHWLVLDEVDGALDGASALTLHEELTVRSPESVGIVVASRHPEVVQRPGWRYFRLNPECCSLIEEAGPEGVLPCHGKSTASARLGAAYRPSDMDSAA